jgi:hypothetical protein
LHPQLIVPNWEEALDGTVDETEADYHMEEKTQQDIGNQGCPKQAETTLSNSRNSGTERDRACPQAILQSHGKDRQEPGSPRP